MFVFVVEVTIVLRLTEVINPITMTGYQAEVYELLTPVLVDLSECDEKVVMKQSIVEEESIPW